MYELGNHFYQDTEVSLMFLRALNVTGFLIYEDHNIFLLYLSVTLFFFFMLKLSLLLLWSNAGIANSDFDWRGCFATKCFALLQASYILK